MGLSLSILCRRRCPGPAGAGVRGATGLRQRTVV